MANENEIWLNSSERLPIVTVQAAISNDWVRKLISTDTLSIQQLQELPHYTRSALCNSEVQALINEKKLTITDLLKLTEPATSLLYSRKGRILIRADLLTSKHLLAINNIDVKRFIVGVDQSSTIWEGEKLFRAGLLTPALLEAISSNPDMITGEARRSSIDLMKLGALTPESIREFPCWSGNCCAAIKHTTGKQLIAAGALTYAHRLAMNIGISHAAFLGVRPGFQKGYCIYSVMNLILHEILTRRYDLQEIMTQIKETITDLNDYSYGAVQGAFNDANTTKIPSGALKPIASYLLEGDGVNLSLTRKEARDNVMTFIRDKLYTRRTRCQETQRQFDKQLGLILKNSSNISFAPCHTSHLTPLLASRFYEVNEARCL